MTSLRSATRAVPLRYQLMAVVLVLVILALGVTGITATSVLRNSLVDRLDTQLSLTAQEELRRPSLAIRGTDEGGPRSDNPGLARPTGPALLSSFYTLTVDADGTGTANLRNPEGAAQSPPDLPVLTATEVAELGTDPFDVSSVDGLSQWRVQVTPLAGTTGAYVVAVNLSEVDQTVDRLEQTVVITSVIVLAALSILGYLLVRSRLKKLVQVEHTAERIAAGDLSQRVPNEDNRTEVGRVAAAINAMMSQIETSFAAQTASENEARVSEARMRRFVADASHELRTPLTSIRGFAELSRQVVDGKPAAPQAMDRIESEAQRMSGLVEDLLVLARLDQQRPLENAPVDLYDIVADAVLDAPAAGPHHHVRLEVEDRARALPVIAMGDEAKLRQVVANLMMNAYTHTPAGTAIEVRLKVDGDEAVIEIADNGPGMDSDDAARIFERFYRSDPSRTRASGGSGLGLSIVQGIVDALGGTVSVLTSPGQGATFTLRLPMVATDDD